MTDYVQYALYRGEEFVMSGSARDVAEHESIGVEEVYRLATPSVSRRYGDRRGSRGGRVVVRLGRDNEEEK